MWSLLKYSFLLLTLSLLYSCSKSNNDFLGNDTGTGGSLARFTISRDHLYVVDGRNLYTFSLEQPGQPKKIYTNNIGFDIETLYTWEDKLFIGSRDAMYIYSIADATKPALLGSARHVSACDPVVARDSVAYVTIRTGTNCGGSVNALIIYNLQDLLQPAERNRIPLDNPHGLGLQDQTLFVCDGASGLRVYDLKNPYSPTQKQLITGDTFYDCIPYENLLLCMIEGGMIIYEITPERQLKSLSRITQ